MVTFLEPLFFKVFKNTTAHHTSVQYTLYIMVTYMRKRQSGQIKIFFKKDNSRDTGDQLKEKKKLTHFQTPSLKRKRRRKEG